MTRMIGHGKPTGIFRPPGGSVMPFSCAYWVARPGGQKLALANATTPMTSGAAEDAEEHLGPHRPHRKAELLPLATAVDEQAR